MLYTALKGSLFYFYLRRNQQQWSCQDVVSILWDVMISNKCLKYNDPSKPILLICMGGYLKPFFLGRHRPER